VTRVPNIAPATSPLRHAHEEWARHLPVPGRIEWPSPHQTTVTLNSFTFGGLRLRVHFPTKAVGRVRGWMLKQVQHDGGFFGFGLRTPPPPSRGVTNRGMLCLSEYRSKSVLLVNLVLSDLDKNSNNKIVMSQINLVGGVVSSGLELKAASEAPSLEGLDPEDRIFAIVQWFHENFEDPAQHTPYESREGGYQYIWGGPHDAREEIEGAFSDATDEEIELAVDEVQSDGTFDWAPHDNRILPDDLEDGPDHDQHFLEGRLDQLRLELVELEAVLDQLRNQAPMIGHNHPPDDMRVVLDQRDINEAKESIDDIKNELDKIEPLIDSDPVPLERARGRFRLLADKIKGWALTAGKWAGVAVGTGALTQVGKELWQDPVALYGKIEGIISVLESWIKILV
jgi:hypothetical protein